MSFGGFSDIQRDRDRAHSSRHRNERRSEELGEEDSCDDSFGDGRGNSTNEPRVGGVGGTYRGGGFGGGGGKYANDGDIPNRYESNPSRDDGPSYNNCGGGYGDTQRSREDCGSHNESYGNNRREEEYGNRQESGNNTNRNEQYGTTNHGEEYTNANTHHNRSEHSNTASENRNRQTQSPPPNNPNSQSTNGQGTNPLTRGTIAEAGITHFAKAYDKSASTNKAPESSSTERPAEPSAFAQRLQSRQEAESGPTLVKQAFGGVKATIEKLTGERK